MLFGRVWIAAIFFGLCEFKPAFGLVSGLEDRELHVLDLRDAEGKLEIG